MPVAPWFDLKGVRDSFINVDEDVLVNDAVREKDTKHWKREKR